MRATSRLLATVKSASKYLEANTPTGLTGLTTHPSPRPALVYTYRQTLKKLSQIPKGSVYRQSVEAITQQRLSIVESTKPEGYEQWLERVRKQIEASPKAYAGYMNEDGSFASEKTRVDEIENWDGRITKHDAQYEGTNNLAQAEHKAKVIRAEIELIDTESIEGVMPTVEDLEVEPPLNREQYVSPGYGLDMIPNTLHRIDSIEKKVGAGLIEEILSVAEGELLLVDEMLQSQPYVLLLIISPCSCMYLLLTTAQLGRARREDPNWSMELL